MTKRKGIRVLSMLALCALLICSFSMTAFAYADDTEQNLPVTEATQPDEMTEPETPAETLSEGEPIDDEGNAYTRDLLYDKTTNKQFITIQTKSGNTFYVVIDYDAPINEEEEQYQTYFLNMVDESDLLALLDEDTAAALTTCNCKEKCAVLLNNSATNNDTAIKGAIPNNSPSVARKVERYSCFLLFPA